MQNGIKQIQLRNFRSYQFLDLKTDNNYVIFVGDNGAGKTNILEGISLLSSTKGLRKALGSDLKNNNSIGEWKVAAELSYENCSTNLETFSSCGKRIGRIDSSPIKTLSEFEKILWFLWVTPQMNDILLGQTQIKRSFFDHLVSGIDPHHNFRIQFLKKLQKERMHILLNNFNANWIGVIEQKMADLFVKIFNTRCAFLEILKNTLELSSGSFSMPIVTCDGEVENLLNHNVENSSILEKLCESRIDDKQIGYTTFSVTRSNWRVFKTQALPIENCSSGEQKAMLISLIIAAIKIYKKQRRGVPILLLDDVMVHLDSYKRSLLFEELNALEVQTFLTGTDRYLFKDFENNSIILNVKNSICC